MSGTANATKSDSYSASNLQEDHLSSLLSAIFRGDQSHLLSVRLRAVFKKFVDCALSPSWKVAQGCGA
jgi:hypothetical protein